MKFSGGRVWWDWWWGYKCVISRLRAVCFLMRWRPLLLPLQAETHPVPRRGSHYGYKEISEALTYEANSQFFSLTCLRPRAVALVQQLSGFVSYTHSDHWGSVLSHRRKWRWFCLCVCVCWGCVGVWSRLRWSFVCLRCSKVFQQSSAACSLISGDSDCLHHRLFAWETHHRSYLCLTLMLLNS